MQRLKELPWLMIGIGALVAVWNTWTIFQHPSNSAIASSLTEDVTLSDLLTVARDEGLRIRGVAPTDPECGTTPDPIDCFLDRLERENNQALSSALFRKQALIEARKIDGQVSN